VRKCEEIFLRIGEVSFLMKKKTGKVDYEEILISRREKTSIL